MKNNTSNAVIETNKSNNNVLFRCEGNWSLNNISHATSQLNDVLDTVNNKSEIIFDISSVKYFDSAGIIFLLAYVEKFKEITRDVEIIGADDKQERMLMMFKESVEHRDVQFIDKHYISNLFESIGKVTIFLIKDIIEFVSFIGETFTSLLHYITHPSSIRFKAIIKNIDEAGVRALPIIALTSFLIGVVLAYQSAVQLEKFGANIFIVDLISISVARELAPLITAIVVAGRSGSSYTAQIGAMKITEEIDAMETMSFNPFRFLVIPRMIALMISLPLLIFFADIIGIFGGMFISEIHLSLSYSEFINRLQTALNVKHFWIGIFKGPFFACLIAAIACFRGFQVSRKTESIGRYTTISVVNAIFLVIACDAIFSVIFTELGI
jgi:phospholipid/cholesterol/gamma-HCH transport system permease protein